MRSNNRPPGCSSGHHSGRGWARRSLCLPVGRGASVRAQTPARGTGRQPRLVSLRGLPEAQAPLSPHTQASAARACRTAHPRLSRPISWTETPAGHRAPPATLCSRRPTSSASPGSIRLSPLLLAGRPAPDPLPSHHSHPEPSLWGFPKSVPAQFHSPGRNFSQGPLEATSQECCPWGPWSPKARAGQRKVESRGAKDHHLPLLGHTCDSAAPHTLGHPVPPQGPLSRCSHALPY